MENDSLPFRDCLLASAFSRKCFSKTHSMCGERGPSWAGKFHPMRLPPITWRSTCSLASLLCPRSGGNLLPHWNPWPLELVNIGLCQGPTATLQLAGIEPVCREEIVRGLFSLDRLMVGCLFRGSQRGLGWQPGDLGYRPSRSQCIPQRQTA